MATNRNRFQSLDEEVSGVVRAELSRRRLAQTDIAAAIGMHPNVFGRKCRGQAVFTPAELSQVGKYIELSAAEITAVAEERFAQTHSVGVA